MDRVSQAFDNYDLKINTSQTEVVYQPARGKPYIEPTIIADGQVVEKKKKLKKGQNHHVINGCTFSRHCP